MQTILPVPSEASKQDDLGTLRRPYRGQASLHRIAVMKIIIQSSRRQTYHINISAKALCSELDATAFYLPFYDFTVLTML